MDEYANDRIAGCLLTFLTVTCLAGLHEVARELENPFRNIPNEIPLVTLQAMFNESLLTLLSGYHPDHFWDGDEYATFGEQKLKEEMNSTFTTDSTVSPQKAGQEADKPQSTLSSTRNQKALNIKQLQDLISKQQGEIDRLCSLVEGESGPARSDKENGL